MMTVIRKIPVSQYWSPFVDRKTKQVLAHQALTACLLKSNGISPTNRPLTRSPEGYDFWDSMKARYIFSNE